MLFGIYAFLMVTSGFLFLIFPLLIYFFEYKKPSLRDLKEFFTINAISLMLFYPINFCMKLLCNVGLDHQKYIFISYFIFVFIQLMIILYKSKEKFFLILISAIFINSWFFIGGYSNYCPMYDNIKESRAYLFFFAGIFGLLFTSIVSWVIIIKSLIKFIKNYQSKKR